MKHVPNNCRPTVIAEWEEWRRLDETRVADELRRLVERVERGDVEWVSHGIEVARFAGPPPRQVRPAAPSLRVFADRLRWPSDWPDSRIRLMLSYVREDDPRPEPRSDLTPVTVALMRGAPEPARVVVRRVA